MKKNIFTTWKALLGLGGSCGVRGKWAVASSQPSTSQRSLPFASGRYHLPQVIKQAYQGGMELFYFWQIGSKGYERLAYSGSFVNDRWNLYRS